MIRTRAYLVLLAVDLAASFACGGGGKHAPPAQMQPTVTPPASTQPPAISASEKMVLDAKKSFPRFLDLHAGVIARSCSPTPGVCHQSNNYPDMHSAGSFLSLVNAPCNIQIPDPMEGWDSCEVQGDRLNFGQDSSEIAWLEKRGAAKWHIAFKDAATTSGRVQMSITAPTGDSVIAPPPEWDLGITLTSGSKEGDIDLGPSMPYLADFIDGIMATVVGGDPNRNGVFGGDDPSVPKGALITSGSLERSYLWGRITGTVPGSRMPLANKPLANAEYVALACWIEGLDARNAMNAEAAINYDSCSFAKSPVAYSILMQ
jgi:hypothetical protein